MAGSLTDAQRRHVERIRTSSLDMHGGTLSVESRLGAGSVFSFALPRLPA